MNDQTYIVMLGTGTPNPVPDRSGPCVAVVVGNRAYLVDFGSGVVRQCERARRMGVAALSPQKLDIAFCTHLHSDHTLGIADLIFTPWVLERETPMHFFGPRGLGDMVAHTTKAFAVDIAGRLASDCPTPGEGYKTEVTEIGPGPIFKDAQVRVEAFCVEHPPFEAYGYKFVTSDRTVVISGDTTPCHALTEAARGCDVLVHEVMSHTGVQRRTPDWNRYHNSVHTSSVDLGKLAQEAGVGMLVLYHQLFMCGENETGAELALKLREQEMLAEIGRHYKGPVYSARDLDIY